MRHEHTWYSEDGTAFDSRDECAFYEATIALDNIVGDGSGKPLLANAEKVVEILRPFIPRKPRGPRKAKANGAHKTPKAKASAGADQPAAA